MRHRSGRSEGTSDRQRDAPEWTQAPEVRLDPAGSAAAGKAEPRARPTNGRIWAAIAAVLVLVVAVSVSQRHRRVPNAAKPAPVLTSPSPSTPAPLGGEEPVLAVGKAGSILDIAVGRSLYALYQDPPRLVVSDALGTNLSAVRTRVLPLPSVGRLLSVDQTTQVLWIVSDQSADSSAAQPYDEATMTKDGPAVIVPTRVNGIAASAGTAWLTGPTGLFYIRLSDASDGAQRLTLRAGLPTRVNGVSGPTNAVSVDAANTEVVVGVGNEIGEDLADIDPQSATVRARAHLPLVNVSLAVTASGVWYAGSGDPGGYGGVGMLSVLTLEPQFDLTTRLGVGPGAVVWPGTSVVWVSTDGDGVTSCLAAADGTVLTRWTDLSGRVVSNAGDIAGLGLTAVQRLHPTGDCIG